ncbi:MAG: hypothetical protein JRM95_04615 [Nitrososphaerota archaeon]|jgi:hypothetical protein|nr:hypothetical protein [Nitrososphaerota archaeon]
MTSSVLLLRTSSGTQPVPVEADFVEISEVGKDVEFTNAGAIVDTAEILLAAEGNPPEEERKALMMKLIRTLGRFHVVSFRRELVEGYYQGEGSKLGLAV